MVSVSRCGERPAEGPRPSAEGRSDSDADAGEATLACTGEDPDFSGVLLYESLSSLRLFVFGAADPLTVSPPIATSFSDPARPALPTLLAPKILRPLTPAALVVIDSSQPCSLALRSAADGGDSGGGIGRSDFLGNQVGIGQERYMSYIYTAQHREALSEDARHSNARGSQGTVGAVAAHRTSRLELLSSLHGRGGTDQGTVSASFPTSRSCGMRKGRGGGMGISWHGES